MDNLLMIHSVDYTYFNYLVFKHNYHINLYNFLCHISIIVMYNLMINYFNMNRKLLLNCYYQILLKNYNHHKHTIHYF